MSDETAEQNEVVRDSRKGKMVSSYYRIEEKGLTRLLPFCERCGPGYFMADHGDRYTCGTCSFTRYKQPEKKETEET